MILVKIWVTCLLTAILVGCGAGSTPRMIDLVGKDAFPSRDLLSEDNEWKVASKIGLMVHSDATAPTAAPAIQAPISRDNHTRVIGRLYDAGGASL